MLKLFFMWVLYVISLRLCSEKMVDVSLLMFNHASECKSQGINFRLTLNLSRILRNSVQIRLENCGIMPGGIPLPRIVNHAQNSAGRFYPNLISTCSKTRMSQPERL